MIVPLLNEHIVNEYREVLSRPKFRFPQDIIDTAVGELERLGLFIDAESLETELPAPKDRVFYEVVMEKRKEEGSSDDAYPVTGNIKHFPSEPFIVTPRQMLEIIFGNLEK